jgi:hypothetical protein
MPSSVELDAQSDWRATAARRDEDKREGTDALRGGGTEPLGGTARRSQTREQCSGRGERETDTENDCHDPRFVVRVRKRTIPAAGNLEQLHADANCHEHGGEQSPTRGHGAIVTRSNDGDA